MNPHKMIQKGPMAETLESIRRLDDKGCLYEMTVDADYYPYEELANSISIDAGCSVMVTPNVAGETLVCRNYDYTHYRYGKETSTDELAALDVVVRTNNPNAKYKSVGMADAYWLDAAKGTFFEGVLDDGETDISPAALLPFFCMDGLNSAGLSVNILALPPDGKWEPTEYRDYGELTDEEKKMTVLLGREAMRPWRELGEVKNGTMSFNTYEKLGWKYRQLPSVEQKVPGRRTMTHPCLMRRFLDYCATVDEAVEMAMNTNIRAPLPTLDFHIVVADRSGRSVVLEWVDEKLRVNDTDHVTNFYVTKRGSREHGGDRDAVLDAALKRWSHGMPEYSAKGVLQVAAANLPLTKIGAFTYWSVIYNLDQGTMKLWHMTDYDNCYEYTI